MDRVPELGVKLEEKREAAKAVLAAARTRGDAMTAAERTSLAALTEEIHGLESTLRAEEEQLAWDRRGAAAVDRPADERATDDDERTALALRAVPVPARTRRKLAALAGGAVAPLAQRREHFAAVVAAALGGNPFHPAIVAATSTEGVGSEGGFAVRADVSADIWSRAAEESVFMRIGARVETMNSETKEVIALDDDDESGDAEAGLVAGWTGEAAEATAQVMKIRKITLTAKKLLVLAAVSNELGDDGPSYVDALEPAISRAIAKKFDRAALSGNGVGQPLGILDAPSTIEVAKTVGGDPGTANTFTWNHVVGMWSRLAPGTHENAWFLMHPTVLPQALSMTMVAGTSSLQPTSAFQQGGPTGYMLLGRPVLITGRVKPLSSKGDVILLDPTQYAIGIRRQITLDRSEHVYFSSDRLAIRGKFRGDGAPMWDVPRTMPEGSTTVGPAVVLQAR